MTTYEIGSRVLYNLFLGPLDIERKNDTDYLIEVEELLSEFGDTMGVDASSVEGTVALVTDRLIILYDLGMTYEMQDNCFSYEELIEYFPELPKSDRYSPVDYFCIDKETEQCIGPNDLDAFLNGYLDGD